MTINYEENKDCFKLTENIVSHLIIDNKQSITHPFITVFIPTYKRADLLKEALVSVIKQCEVDFEWDIIVVDNEPYDGKMNETEQLIRTLKCNRIAYYRNSENMRVGDNFNRGILLARAPWVMMLHDDDLLVRNTLYKMGKAIRFLSSLKGLPLGAIGAAYHQFKEDVENHNRGMRKIEKLNRELTRKSMSFKFYKIGRFDCLFSSHPGGVLPSNGSAFNREAFIECGGFNDDFGICADLILFHCLTLKYSNYMTLEPYGFYRYGLNSMSKEENIYKTIQACYKFREFMYNFNIVTKLWGILFRKFHSYLFFYTFFPNYKGTKKYIQKPGKLQSLIGMFFFKKFEKFKLKQAKKIARKFKRNERYA